MEARGIEPRGGQIRPPSGLATKIISLSVRRRRSGLPASRGCALFGALIEKVLQCQWRCWIYNPSVAGSIGRGTGNLTGSEQVVIRRVSGRNRSRAGGEARAQDQARPGRKARPGVPFPRAWKSLRPGADRANTRGAARVSVRMWAPRNSSKIILLQGRAAATGGRQGRRCSRLRPGSMTAGSNLTGSARLA